MAVLEVKVVQTGEEGFWLESGGLIWGDLSFGGQFLAVFGVAFLF